MLTIEFHNDSTGTEITGNYNYRVIINDKLIANGRVEGHQRKMGWVFLLIQFARDLSQKVIADNKEKLQL